MAAQSFRLVFHGKIAPDKDLDQVKVRLQQLFKKDAQTIEKLFSGKKVSLKQGLNQSQAIQYKEKLRAMGILCDMEAQLPPKAAAATSGVSRPAATVQSDKPLKFADIDKAFVGTIPKVDPSLTYKAGIVAVGLTMVLLPLLYLALIALTGYGVMHHAMVNTSWMHSMGAKLGTLAYVTPIVAGVTVILFMLKPLFARPADEPKTVTLDPLKEPIFVHFVYKIALAVGAPRPKHIQIDCDVNAAASFHRGIFGLLGNDLVLTIGLPLIAGFNTRQLAGVLAHEFGHFSQGVGMRFHYLTYKINSWLFHAVYTRDTWDQKLDEAAEQSADWINIILNIARAGVWFTRKILYVFMMIGHAVSSYMLRQMEFDADRYEIFMAGSKQFKDTTLQLQRLGAAFQISHDHLAQAWEEKKLVNDFPSLIAHNATQLPPEINKAVLRQIEEAKTQVYDSHPSDKQRIEKAMQEQAPGVFALACESRELFKSFSQLAKQVTIHHYDNDLGLEFEKDKLVDVTQVVKLTRDHEQQQEAYSDYFKEMAPVFAFPLAVNIFDTSKVDWDKLVDQYQEVNDRIVNEAVGRNRLMSAVNKAYRQYQIFDTIGLLKQAKLVMLPEWFDLDDEIFGKHEAQLETAEHAWQQRMKQLQSMFALNDQRLSIALTLLNHPKLIGRNKEHAHHLKMRNRLSLLINNFKRNTDTIIDFEYKKFRLTAVLSCARAIGQKSPDLQSLTDQLLEEFKESFVRLSGCLHRLDYPFVAEGEHETIAGYLETLLPKRQQCGSELEYYLSSGNVIEEKLESIYKRIISGLAAIALNVDRLLPTMDEEPETQVQEKQQPVAISGAASQQSNLAFKSSDYFGQPGVSDSQSESARAFYDAAVMGSDTGSKLPVSLADMNPGTDNADRPASSTTDKAVGGSQPISNLQQQPRQPGLGHTENQQPQPTDAGADYPATGAIWQAEPTAKSAPGKPVETKHQAASGADAAVAENGKDDAGSVRTDPVAKDYARETTDGENNKGVIGINAAGGDEPATQGGTQDQQGTDEDKAAAPNVETREVANLNLDAGDIAAGEAVSHEAVSHEAVSNEVTPKQDPANLDQAAVGQTDAKDQPGDERPADTSPAAPQANVESPALNSDTGEAAMSVEAPLSVETKDTAAELESAPVAAESQSQTVSPRAMDAMAQSIDNLRKTVDKLKTSPVKMPPAGNAAAITSTEAASLTNGADKAEDIASSASASETGDAPNQPRSMQAPASAGLPDAEATLNSPPVNESEVRDAPLSEVPAGGEPASDTPSVDVSSSEMTAGDISVNEVATNDTGLDDTGLDDTPAQKTPATDTGTDETMADGALSDIDDELADHGLPASDQDDASVLDPVDMEHELQLRQVKLDQTVIEVMAELDDLDDELAMPTGELDDYLPLETGYRGRGASNTDAADTQSGLEMAASLEEVINYGQQQTSADANNSAAGNSQVPSQQPAGSTTTAAGSVIGNATAEANRESLSAAAPGSNQRLSEALAKMAEKRNNWRSYLNQINATVVAPGLETADRYASIKHKSSTTQSGMGEEQQAGDMPGGEQPTTGATPAQTASPMADRVLELQRVTRASVKREPASPTTSSNADDNVQTDNNRGGDEASQESPSV